MSQTMTGTGSTESFTSNLCDNASSSIYKSTDISGMWIRYYFIHAVTLVGSASNILVLFVVTCSRRMRSSPSGVLLLSLSSIDTLVLIMERLETLTKAPLGDKRLPLRPSTLTIVFYLKYTGRCAASFLIACISVNRFAVVVYPLRSKWFLQWRNAAIQVAVCVVLAAVLNIFVMFYPPVNNTQPGGYFYGTVIVEIVLSDMVVSLVIMVLSGYTAYTFLQTGKNIRRFSKSSWTSHTQSSERQVTVLLLTVAITYVVLRMQYKLVWIPLFFLHHHDRNRTPPDSLRMAYYITYCFYLLNYSTNLYQYCLCSSVFRNEFRRIFSCNKYSPAECRKVSVSSTGSGGKHNVTAYTSINLKPLPTSL